MLFVFCVDTGTMYKFNMELSMQPVTRLKETIAKMCRVPVDKQVLLISGGEPLARDKLVCTYSAGTQIHEIDTEELKACERLVLDQHLQQQGWAAVVANLEDLVSAFSQRAKLFQKEFCQYIATREDILALLRRIPETLVLVEKIPLIPETLVLLEKIPVLTCLEGAQDQGSVTQSQTSVDAQSHTQRKGQVTLYSWINTQDPKNRMEDVINNLHTGTMQMNEALEEKVVGEITDATNYTQAPEMKEVKGLEDRLYGLDQLMSTARKLLEEQHHMAQGFVQNQTRLSDLKDNSILPDLCSSHKRQLTQMLSNHKKLRDIKRKCTAAKEELSANLHTRLRWVMYVQRTVNSMDNKLWLYHDNVDRIKTRAGLLHQVETAPMAYASMIVEVVRRRLFSQHYMKWVVEVSQESRRQHKKEMQRRKSFTRQYGSHFLQKMFTGFRDNVPKFADVWSVWSRMCGVFVWSRMCGVFVWSRMCGVFVWSRMCGVFARSRMCGVFARSRMCGLFARSRMCGLFARSRMWTVCPVPDVWTVCPVPDVWTVCPVPGVWTVCPVPDVWTVCPVPDVWTVCPVQDVWTVCPVQDTEPPKEFDGSLPCISQADVGAVGQAVPELRHLLRIPSETGSPGMASSFQTPLAADGGSEPRTTAVTQSMISVAQSVMSTTRSVSGSLEGHDALGVLLFEPAERDRLSLSYQEERQGERRMSVDDRLALSLQEQFTVPECLSETLTAEVNSAAMSTITVSVMSSSPQTGEVVGAEGGGVRQERHQQQEGSGDGQLLSSGDQEPTKSSDSDAVSHESLTDRKPRSKRRGKATSDTSPDVETSQEFTTADFYIEDSMPSSMTDSPPKPSASDKEESEVDSMLVEKTQRVTQLEAEVSALQNKLAASVDKTAQLQTMLNKDVRVLKDSLASIRGAVMDSRSMVTRAVSEVEGSVLSVCTSFVEEMERCHGDMLNQERDSSQVTVSGLESQLDTKNRHIEELQQELQQVRESSQKELLAMQEKHEAELVEIKSKSILETELEADHIRTEMQAAMDKQEAEIARLEEQLHQAEKRLHQVQQEREVRSEELVRGFVAEKEKMSATLEEEFASSKQREINQLLERLGTQHKQELEAARTDMQQKMEQERRQAGEEKIAEMEKLRAEMQAVQVRQVEEVREKLAQEHKMELEQLLEQSRSKAAETLGQLRAEFDAERDRTQAELRSLQQRPLTMEQATQSEGGEVMTLERHQELVAEVERAVMERHQELVTEAERAVKLQVTLQYQQVGDVGVLNVAVTQVGDVGMTALEDQRSDLERKMEEMIRQHQKDKDESMASMKTSVMAERQVQFNEAVSRAVQDKDRTIEELRNKVKELESQVSGDELNAGDGNTDSIRKRLTDVKERELQLIRENRRLEDEVALMQQQLSQYSNQLHSMATSTAPLSPTVVTDAAPFSLTPARTASGGQMEESISRTSDWEQIANMREQRISELETKLMTMSMTASTRREARDKVSILSCYVGDLVLLCLDDRHDQYVVFTVGNTLHFLHSDSVDSLGLKPVEGEPRKNWVLAEITEREYCQARKPQNRFKVPVGTKFYRVKAKPWNPGGSSG
ncbi:hypothetical protein BaRGS_00019674 [Batillaria attramentaria]|uniref:RB1-inducible coiled-coil protein 1 n=1 Tax=Batillaria attramentaria TaxID=370345 RepID=A0ABD0KPZ1_9CAEN